MVLKNIKAVESHLSDVNSHDLIRLIYISQVKTNDDKVFEHIQCHSNSYNKSNNIKGFLCNNSDYFVQCLEGSKSVVLNLMQRIYRDCNHTQVNVIMAKKVKGFIFSDWRMRSLNLNNEVWKEQQAKVSINEFLPFKPETWQPWFVELFLKTIKEYNSPSLAYNKLNTFDTINFKRFETFFASNSLLFWLFLLMMSTSSFTLVLFNFDVITY